MVELSVLIGVIVLLFPPILAYKGKGFRGLWVAMILIGLLVAWFGNEMFLDTKGAGGKSLIMQGHSVERVVMIAQFWDALTIPGIAFAIGSLFAVCFFRNRKPAA